ncbi:hypothetical protein BJ912DRAFT_929194 [Pholiota molesta]|nr:hypothetical protein BJ912DRAFT_929194 [Pholiota molesta]
MSETKTASLSERLEMAVGMKVMITSNISTEGDIANGTRGVIKDILLDAREPTPTPDEHGVVYLRYPPATVLFKPNDGTPLRFEGIEAGVVPLSPVMETFTVSVQPTRKSQQKTYQIRRRQFEFTAGYAFTDYKSQGQTLERVLIDIGEGFTLSQYNVYVALSRSRGRDTIRLLRPFDKRLFTNHPSEALRDEMRRLELLNVQTKIKFLEQRGRIR